MPMTCGATRVRHPRRLFAVVTCVFVFAYAWVPPMVTAAESAVVDSVAVQDPVPGDLNGDGAARVVAVGDSIMKGAAPQIDEAFRAAGYEVAVDADVNRSTLAGVDLVRFYTAMGADAVVVMLGANDAGNPETFRNRVRSVVDAAQGAPLLMWMTIPEVRDYYPAANQILREEMSARAGGSVLEWSPAAAVQGVTAGDGLHLTPTGIVTMTGFLVPSVVATINAAQVGTGGSGDAARTSDATTSTSPPGRGDADDEESPDDEPDRDSAGDRRILPGAADSIDSILGPDRFAVAAILAAAALACGGLGVALWSLSRTGRRNARS